MLIVAVALAALVGAAFAVDRWNASVNGEGGGYAVAVKRDGREVRRFTIEQLTALGVKTVKMQGKEETGPTLLAVLRAAGVDSFESVTVVGLGARDSGRIELQRSSIDDEVLLDVANRGTTKVCGPRIPYGSRVRDVTDIEVR